MLTLIKSKLILIISAITAVLIAVVKYQSNKISKLKKSLNTMKAKEDIAQKQVEYSEHVNISEINRIKDRVKENEKLSKINQLNSL